MDLIFEEKCNNNTISTNKDEVNNSVELDEKSLSPHKNGIKRTFSDLSDKTDINDTFEKDVKIFSWDEKIDMCNKLKKQQRDMLITFGNITKYKLPFLKTDEMANRICEYLNTEKAIITYMTIAYEQADTGCPFPHVHIAIKLDSKHAPNCGSVKKKLYKLFTDYHGNIDISTKNNTCYLEKAKYLICPSKDKKVDPEPYVMGETYIDLCKRIENAASGAVRSREIRQNWNQEMIQAARKAEGNFEAYMESDVYKELGQSLAYQLVTCFRELSKKKKVKLEEEIYPLSDYSKSMVNFMDRWYDGPKKKGDTLLFQGDPDTGKTRFLFSWAAERGLSVYKCPSSLREWYGYEGQDICIWDDMSEDRKDLGGQRMSQLLDGQVVSLDVKCVQGIEVKCPKIIITMNNDFDFYDSPAKFKARVCLVKIQHHLSNEKINISKYPFKIVRYNEHGLKAREKLN